MDTTNIAMMKSLIESAKKILLVTHKNPDPDTLGAAIAFYDALWRMQKKVFIFNATHPMESYLQALPWIEKVTHELPKSFDLAISFDCGDFARLGMDKPDVPFINIDHHLSNEGYGSINLIEPDCISTTQVVFNLFGAFGWKISNKAAQALYMGLVSDSVQFGTDRVTSEVFDMASRLIALGANASQTHQALFESHSLARLRLVQKMLGTLSLHHDGLFGVVYATQEMFETTGATLGDAKAALSMVLGLGVVQIVLMLCQTPHKKVKGSLRSKCDIDVNALAATVGGGGHKRASGFESDLSIEALQAHFIKITKKECEYATKE